MGVPEKLYLQRVRGCMRKGFLRRVRACRGVPLCAVLLVFVIVAAVEAQTREYAGSKACAECHEGEYERFAKYSKKAHSWKSVSVMASDLKPHELEGCYECHTTGYKKGGFVNFESTPHLADVGCETCHGPGAEHAETGDPESIVRRPELATCESCHNASRVGAFKFKPLIHSGAH